MRLQRDQLTTGLGPRAQDFLFELTPNVEEADGLPAEIPFGPHASLVNLDYVRLRDTNREAITTLATRSVRRPGAAYRD